MTPDNATRVTFTLVDVVALEGLLTKWRKDATELGRACDSEELDLGRADGLWACVDDLENLLAGKRP
jgi:hypothetical protein